MTSPIIETNIERILEDHLFVEVDAIEARIKEYQENIDALRERMTKLLNIADAAGISR